MSNKIQVDVQGFQELTKKLKELGNDKDKRREALIILRQVAKPTLEVARSLAPVSKEQHFSRGKYIQPGALKKSLGYITVRTEDPQIAVGPRAKGKRYDGWYGHMVHEGHEYFVSANQNKNVRTRAAKNYSKIDKKRAGTNGVNKRRRTKAQRAKLIQSGRLRMTKSQPYLSDSFKRTQGRVTGDAEKRFATFLQRRIKKLSI